MIFGLGESCASRGSHVLEKGYHHDLLHKKGYLLADGKSSLFNSYCDTTRGNRFTK